MEKLPRIPPARNARQPSAAPDPLGALIDAVVARAVDAAFERAVELQKVPQARVVDTDAICREFGISRPTLRAEILRGLPFIAVGTLKRFVVDDVVEWYRRQCQPEITDVESAEFQREAAEVLEP